MKVETDISVVIKVRLSDLRVDDLKEATVRKAAMDQIKRYLHLLDVKGGRTGDLGYVMDIHDPYIHSSMEV